MLTLIKKLLAVFLILILCIPGIVYADRIGMLISEPDGTPDEEYAYILTVPDGTASIANSNLTLNVASAVVPLTIVPSATDPIAIDIQGETNDYTGAGAAVTFNLTRDVNRGTGAAIPNYAGWQSYLNAKHTDALIAGDREVYGAISRIDNQGRITNATATDYQYFTVGAHNTSKMSPTAAFDTDSTGILKLAITGTYGYVFADSGWTIYDTSTGSPANTVTAAGVRAFVENDLTLDGTAAATVINAGFYVDQIIGSTAGTSLGAGLYIPAGVVVGSDTNYAIYSLETDPSYLAGSLEIAALTANGVLTVKPDGTNEVFQVNDGTIDTTDGNAGTTSTLTIDSDGDWSLSDELTVNDILTIIPDGTNEVFQVDDGTIDFTDGNGGVTGVLTVSAGGDWSYNKDLSLSNGALNVAGLVTADALLAVKNGATTSGYIDIYEDSTNGTNYLRFDVPEIIAADLSLIFDVQDTSSSITLDEQTFEVEGEGTATQLTKIVNGSNAAATLTIEGTAAVVNQDLTTNATSVEFASLGIGEATPDEMLHLTSSTTSKPVIKIENTNADSGNSFLSFNKVLQAGEAADGDKLGTVQFNGTDAAGNAVENMVAIIARQADVTDGDEAGDVRINVMMDGTQREMLRVSGYNGAGVGQGEFIINNTGQDVDTTIEASGVTDALVVRGSDGQITLGFLGIGDVQSSAAGVLSVVSDERVKTHIGSLEDGAIEKIMELEPVYFTMNNDPTNLKMLGFYANDVHPILPEAAPYNKDSDLYGFNNRSMTALLVKAFQEQQVIIKGLQERLEKMEQLK